MSSGTSAFRYHSYMSEPAELQPETIRTERPAKPAATARKRNWSEIIVATGTVLAFCYFAKWELAVILISRILRVRLGPVVELLQRVNVSRGVGVLIQV